MTNQLASIEQGIKESLRSYLKTAYRTNSEVFNDALVDFIITNENSPVFKESLFELIPRYDKDNRNFAEVIEQYFDSNSEELKKFLSTIDLNEVSLFSHQVESIQATIRNSENIVVTTGTGSGKTLCFLIPVLFNLLREALGIGQNRGAWPAINQQGTSDYWWQHDKSNFKCTRDSVRTTAVRCLMIYPLNALVRDQIETLRKVLGGKQAKEFYNDLLGNDRIYFGQYNGDTIGKRSHKDLTSKHREKELNEVREELQTLYEELLSLEPGDKKYDDILTKIQDPTSSEMLTRWDMQVTPPDILITNFSMLAIMLVREHENPIFDQTIKWLAESRDNIFYLVLDELHSYRGTGGTEISYTIKQLINRLGLHIGHPQLRIIATSASLEDTASQSDEDHEFIKDFFGSGTGQKNFRVIEGGKVAYPNLEFDLSDLQEAFSTYYTRGQLPGLYRENIANVLSKFLSLGDEHTADFYEVILNQLSRKTSEQKYGQDISISGGAVGFEDIAEAYFNGDMDASKGFINYIVNESYPINFRGKIRQHLFVKNMNGIRAAIDFELPEFKNIKLYDDSASYSVERKAITLDAMYCQVCGELYFKGFYHEHGNTAYISNDRLEEKEKIANLAYINFSDPFSSDVAKKKGYVWQTGAINKSTGQLLPRCSEPKRESEYPVNILQFPEIKPPSSCPACEISWLQRGDSINSPIRTMGTGYHKMRQLMIEC